MAKWIQPAIIFLLTLGNAPPSYSPDRNQYLIIWNVGQGQWITYLTNNNCIHFDMGGDVNPIKLASQLCRSKKNTLFISHPDKDHINFINKNKNELMGLCLNNDLSNHFSISQNQYLKSIKRCPSEEAFPFLYQIKPIWSSHTGNKNDRSFIFLIANQIVISGDSSKKSERLWLKLIPEKFKPKILILGHHGSKTSSSEQYLRRFRKSTLAVSSARSKRYGHPHIETQAALTKYRIPALKTEDFGHIVISMQEAQ